MKCMECHEKEARDVMRTVHWTWSKPQVAQDGRKLDIGKNNALNNFCIGLPGNWPRCTSCHAGYGYKDAKFDFTKAENVTVWSAMTPPEHTRSFRQAQVTRSMKGKQKNFPKTSPGNRLI